NKPTMAVASKEWLTAKDVTANLRDGRTGWHTIDPGPKLSAATERYILEGDKLWLEIEQHKRNEQTTGIVRNGPLGSDGEIRLTVEVRNGEAYLLVGNSLLSPRDETAAGLRLRFGADSEIQLATGKPERTQNNRRTTEYAYVSHIVGEETEYPRGFDVNEILEVVVRYTASKRTAQISVNGAAPVELKTADIIGITFVGLLVSDRGQLRFNSIRTILK